MKHAREAARSIFPERDRGNGVAGTVDPLRYDRMVGFTVPPLSGLRFGISYFLSPNEQPRSAQIKDS